MTFSVFALFSPNYCFWSIFSKIWVFQIFARQHPVITKIEDFGYAYFRTPLFFHFRQNLPHPQNFATFRILDSHRIADTLTKMPIQPPLGFQIREKSDVGNTDFFRV